MSFRTALLATTSILAAASSAHAVDLGKNGEYGKILGDFRYRYEFVDQDGIDKNANANTARLRLGYMTPTVNGFTGYLEGETLQYIGNDNFNDGANGKTKYPSVNDPYDTDINQAYLSYVQPGKGNALVVGRQYLTFDTQRFVGWSKFRQNDTVQDAAHLTVKPLTGLNVDYAYSMASHRSSGSRLQSGRYDGDFNYLHADYALPEDFKLIGYGYLLDFDDFKTLSSDTYGSRLEWRPKKASEWSWGITPLATVEFALQEDAGGNPNNYSEWYNWFEVGGAMNGYSLSAVYERLGGDGAHAMTTPMGTNHSFTGWIDRIDTPPANGLVDMALLFKAPIDVPWEGQKLGFEAQGHHFTSDHDDITYGQEFDLGLAWTPVENHTITAQIGHYMADEYLSDTTKVWLYYDFKF